MLPSRRSIKTFHLHKKMFHESFLNFNNKSVKRTIIFWYIVHIHEFPIKRIFYLWYGMVFCVPFRHERERERENAKNIKWNYYFPIFRNKRECYRTIYGSCCGVDLRLVQLGVEIKLLKLMMHMSNAFVIFPFRAKLKMNPKTSFYRHTMIGG